MFQSKQLIYIQMQKTGCTHIASLLSELLDGEMIGKHNAANADQIKSNRLFLSSIRNPWDWYLSLWTYGVSGGGGVRYRATQKKEIQIILSLKSLIKHPVTEFRTLASELQRDREMWLSLYESGDNVALFRRWLKLIHQPKHSYLLGEGYGETTITQLCGYMTYRYLNLCCENTKILKKRGLINNFAELEKFDQSNCYIDFFIHQESLEDDLCTALEQLRPLSAAEKDHIYKAKKINTSKRSLSISDYYDQESIDLVRSRDQLLIEKFNYLPPQLSI